ELAPHLRTGALGEGRPRWLGHAAGRFDAQGHQLDRRVEREPVERLVRGLERGGDAVHPFDGDLAALTVVAQERYAAQPTVGWRDLLRVEPGAGLALEIGVDRTRLVEVGRAGLGQRA